MRAKRRTVFSVPKVQDFFAGQPGYFFSVRRFRRQ
jgi:hypothetical protein